MDSLTHALVGLAMAGLSGQPPSWDNPIYWAAILGAQAPDFDIAARLKGEFAYICQHRAASHSLPGLLLWPALLAGVLAILWPAAPFFLLYGWALSGSLSHLLLDLLNTHGAALLWPFKGNRLSLPLLKVFDPLLFALLSMTLATPLPSRFALCLEVLALYICVRLLLRHLTWRRLAKHFAGFQTEAVTVMPALGQGLGWDFIVETSRHLHLGRSSPLGSYIAVAAKLPKRRLRPAAEHRLKTSAAGRFFAAFTPFLYMAERRCRHRSVITLYDLRYIINRRCLHRATLIFPEGQSMAAYFHHGQNTMKI